MFAALPIDSLADQLAKKIKHYLMAFLGKTLKEATQVEFYQAFVWSLREEIMIHWLATLQTFRKKQVKMMYYLSMEYMPGRFLGNNIINIKATDLVQRALKKLDYSFEKLLCVEIDPGLGNGGLGRLASCFLDALASQKYPAMGYGLRYQYGIFDQEIWNGVQIERPDHWLLNGNPWEFRRDSLAVNVQFAGEILPSLNERGEDVHQLVNFEEVRSLPYDFPIVGFGGDDYQVLSLRLWSTKESPKNFQLQKYNSGHLGSAAENTSLTDVLYPNENYELGKRMRLKQEFLLVSSSLQDILRQHKENFTTCRNLPELVALQINDTHPALVIPCMMRMLVQEENILWEEAWEIVKACCSYTNHSVLKEAVEEWNEERLSSLFPREFKIIQKLNQLFCDKVRSYFPDDEDKISRLSIIENGAVRMSHLAILGSHKVNGVAFLHTELLKTQIFKDFCSLYPDRFLNITNGISPRRWLLTANPLLTQFLIDKIGSGWITNFSEIGLLNSFASDPQTQKEFLEIKQKNKKRLWDKFIQEKLLRYPTSFEELPCPILFDVQIKRIHEYKRQLMNALHLLILFQEWQSDKEGRSCIRLAIFAGKAAPGYKMAKSIIRFIHILSREIEKAGCEKLRIVFQENYNVSQAESIIPAADLSEQISLAGTEASGTGNMKLCINGALTIGTRDGANLEMEQAITSSSWPFAFGMNAEEVGEIKQNGLLDVKVFFSTNPKITRALEALVNGSLAISEEEHAILQEIQEYLISNDHYFVLRDLESYYETQKKVEMLFQNPLQWSECALRNMSGMGLFSGDYAIKQYAEKIWNITPCPVDLEILSRIKEEFIALN